jgi:DNA primase
MTLTPQWLDELRARTVLSTLIGKSIKVTRAGREHKACCPFHNEKTPSFTINDDKGFYHCFGCGAHGDAIRWMTEQRGLPFMDAVKELAGAAGLEVPAADPRAAARAEAAVSLRDVTEASATWFRERLADSEGAEARAYLTKRGLSAATIDTFALGYAPDARGRLREVLGKFGDDLAVEAGMLIQPPEDAPANRQQPYDRFRGRLMIPIRDARGRTIAFGGRILGTGEPKYLNSPDTPLFDKGRILYNLDRAAPAARKADRLIIVEGYMDVIALAQAGIEEAVAPLGTALTEAQIELAWRQVPVPILAFDGDAAGQRAALRAATRALPLLRPGHSLSFLTLPAGQDPDDIVRSGGAAAFNTLAASPAPLVDLLWRTAYEGRADETPEARANVRKQLFDWADSIADRDVAAHYRQAFKDRIDAAFFAPRPRPQRDFTSGQRGPRGVNSRTVPPERAPTAGLWANGDAIPVRHIEAIIAGLLRYPSRLYAHAEALAGLPIADRDTAQLLAALTDLAFAEQETLDTNRLMTILAEMTVYNKGQQLLRADAIQFSFTRSFVFADDDEGHRLRATAEQRAMRDLDEAISAVVAWPEVERELAAATEAARRNLDAASFEHQQRLLRTKAELAERLASLGETSRL